MGYVRSLKGISTSCGLSIPGGSVFCYWYCFTSSSCLQHSRSSGLIGSELLGYFKFALDLRLFNAWNNFQTYSPKLVGGLSWVIYPGTTPFKKFTNSTNPRTWGEPKEPKIKHRSKPSLVSDHISHQPNWGNSDFVGISHCLLLGGV